MKKVVALDARIKSAVALHTPQQLPEGFAACLRAAAERGTVSDAPAGLPDVITQGTALLPLRAITAVILFIFGLSFGTNYSSFTGNTMSTASLNFYSFYYYNGKGLL